MSINRYDYILTVTKSKISENILKYPGVFCMNSYSNLTGKNEVEFGRDSWEYNLMIKIDVNGRDYLGNQYIYGCPKTTNDEIYEIVIEDFDNKTIIKIRERRGVKGLAKYYIEELIGVISNALIEDSIDTMQLFCVIESSEERYKEIQNKEDKVYGMRLTEGIHVIKINMEVSEINKNKSTIGEIHKDLIR